MLGLRAGARGRVGADVRKAEKEHPMLAVLEEIKKRVNMSSWPDDNDPPVHVFMEAGGVGCNGENECFALVTYPDREHVMLLTHRAGDASVTRLTIPVETMKRLLACLDGSVPT